MAGDDCMSPAACERQRIACERLRMRETAESNNHRSEIAGSLSRLEEKVDALVDLLPRLSSLELWRAKLNGRAEEVARAAHIDQPHHRAGETADHSHQRTVDAVLAVLAAKQAEAFDVGLWMRRNWKPVLVMSAVVIFLAAMAGETLRVMMTPAIYSGLEKVAK